MSQKLRVFREETQSSPILHEVDRSGVTYQRRLRVLRHLLIKFGKDLKITDDEFLDRLQVAFGLDRHTVERYLAGGELSKEAIDSFKRHVEDVWESVPSRQGMQVRWERDVLDDLGANGMTPVLGFS